MKKVIRTSIPLKALIDTPISQAIEVQNRFNELIYSNTILYNGELNVHYKILEVAVSENPIMCCVDCRIIIDIVDELYVDTIKRLSEMNNVPFNELLPTKPPEKGRGEEKCTLNQYIE